MWLFVNNQHCFGYIQITTLNNKNTFGAPYSSPLALSLISSLVCNLGIIFVPSKFDVNLIFRASILNMLCFKISFLLFFNLSPKCNESWTRLPTRHGMFSLIARSLFRIAVQGSREGVSSQLKRSPTILLESRGWRKLGTTVRLHGLYYAQGTQLQDLESDFNSYSDQS